MPRRVVNVTCADLVGFGCISYARNCLYLFVP